MKKLLCIILLGVAAFAQQTPIQLDKDGVTLFYVDASGARVSRYFMEGAPYDEMVKVRDAQLQAVRENTQAVANYQTTLANAQISVDSGRTASAPPKPLQKVVSNTGEVTYVPFDPPLKDLVPYTAKAAPSSGSIVSKDAPPDRQAVMYNMILLIFKKLFPEAVVQ